MDCSVPNEIAGNPSGYASTIATSNRLRMAFLAVGFHSLALKHPVCALASRQLQPKAQRLKGSKFAVASDFQ
jgi:hypothetical protein